MFASISIEQVSTIIALSLVLVGFIGYYFSAKNDQADHDSRPTHEIINMRKQGFIWLGIIPFIAILIFTYMSDFSLSDYGISASFPVENWYWILGFAAVLIPLNFFNAKSKENLLIYPQIREKEWNASLQRKEYVTWFLYLLGYEWLFRGVLFFGCRDVMEFWPALAVNVALYSLVHIPKGLKETVASIPLGILLCIIVERTGVFYAAVIIHFTQAASSSFFSLRAHPDMKIVRS